MNVGGGDAIVPPVASATSRAAVHESLGHHTANTGTQTATIVEVFGKAAK